MRIAVRVLPSHRCGALDIASKRRDNVKIRHLGLDEHLGGWLISEAAG
ncbi:MAG: hypothetical protein ABI912_02585 [Actinomycetota bacterium]